MSQKHEKFSVGQPNEVDLRDSKHFLRDEFGLATDPGEHADSKCFLCSGRGYVTLVAIDAPDESSTGRTLLPCGCSKRRYEKRRKVMALTLGLRQARGCLCSLRGQCSCSTLLQEVK